VERVLADQRFQLGALERAVLERLAGGAGGRVHVDRAPRRLPPPLLAALANRQRERPVVGLGDQVDGRAHQRCLDQRAPLEPVRDGIAVEGFDA
jgi:hypothetical protein